MVDPGIDRQEGGAEFKYTTAGTVSFLYDLYALDATSENCQIQGFKCCISEQISAQI